MGDGMDNYGSDIYETGERISRRIQILDCTLRDGGLNFDDAAKNGLEHPSFLSDTDKIIRHLRDSRVDIIELGSIEITPEDKRCFAIYQNIESVSGTIPRHIPDGQQYAALYRGPDTPPERIPPWRPGLCELVRVILRYSELKKSLEYCRMLADKGYQVCIQPALTMRYSEDDLRAVIRTANEIKAYALYIVDTYGYMHSNDVAQLFALYDAELDDSVRIGFHAHNNMNLAFSNALAFMALPGGRQKIVDSCVMGVGQGAGNLQTELITDHMIRYYGAKYDYAAILEVCEILEGYCPASIWGYSVAPLLSALRGTAYKYAASLRKRYGLTYSEIDRVLSGIPADLRHRYTSENTIQLLKMFGYDDLEERGGKS